MGARVTALTTRDSAIRYEWKDRGAAEATVVSPAQPRLKPRFGEIGEDTMSAPAPFEDSIRRDLESTGIPITAESFVERVSRGDIVNVRTLVQAGMSVRAVEANTGVGLLFAAVTTDSADMVSLLLSHRADPEARIDGGLTPLMAAAAAGRLRALVALVEGGSGLNSRDARRRTALMHAAAANQDKAITLLVEKGARVDLFDHAGMTALMVAAENRRVPAVEALIANGANLDLRNHDGLKARDIAVQKMFADVARVFNSADRVERTLKVVPVELSAAARRDRHPATARGTQASSASRGFPWRR
jgi:ankyrin repeat protein